MNKEAYSESTTKKLDARENYDPWVHTVTSLNVPAKLALCSHVPFSTPLNHGFADMYRVQGPEI